MKNLFVFAEGMNVISLREQKKWLLNEIDTIIKNRGDYIDNKIVIKIPNFTEYIILNTLQSLEDVRKIVEKEFPTSTPKPKKLLNTSCRFTKRITGEDIYYYKPYIKKKQKLLELGKCYYKDNFLITGNYLVKLKENKKDSEGYIPNYKQFFKGDFIESKIIAETFVGYEFLNKDEHFSEYPTCHILTKHNEHYFLDIRFVDIILGFYPNSKMYTAIGGMTIFKINNKIIGLIAPLKPVLGNIEDFPIIIQKGYKKCYE